MTNDIIDTKAMITGLRGSAWNSDFKSEPLCSGSCCTRVSARDNAADERSPVAHGCTFHASALGTGKVLEAADHQWISCVIKDAKLVSNFLRNRAGVRALLTGATKKYSEEVHEEKHDGEN